MIIIDPCPLHIPPPIALGVLIVKCACSYFYHQQDNYNFSKQIEQSVADAKIIKLNKKK